MVARPGRLQPAWTAGELEPILHQRTTLKYFSTGAKRLENVEVIPQGGFRVRDGLADIGAVDADASRLFPFNASNGAAYDLVFRPGFFSAWSATALLQTVAISGLTAPMLPEMTQAQQLDTMLLFHNDLESKRIKHLGATNWQVDNAPFENVFNYDYGGPIGGGSYTNAVAAEWELEFVGLVTGTTVFTLNISGQKTISIQYNSDMLVLAAAIQAAALDLPNVEPGLTAVSSSGGVGGTKVKITFGGTDNVGDGWAVSGDIINKADAAILAFKKVPGVAPGEPLFSADRGWPHCGCFYTQRLLVGGFKSLPNAWAFSKTSDYYNFDERFTEANGPALVPMDVPGGERIERIVSNRNLLMFTTRAEYWIAERKISRTEAPNHVQSSTHGTRRGVPIVENEGASIFVHAGGGVLGEFRYTDVEGNFVATDISLLASHLFADVRDQAVRRSTASTDGNALAVVLGDGAARMATILREQEVTAFTRMTTDGDFRAVSCNGRNEFSWLVDRAGGRRLERSVDGVLLDQARFFTNGSPSAALSGLSWFNGEDIWVIADGHVFGPFTVSGGALTLPRPVLSGYYGTWKPPVATTLPPPRDIGPNVVLQRPARIHSLQINVQDTTSIAVAVNDQPLKDIDLVRFGAAADVPELNAPYTGFVTVRGLTGFRDEPTVTISQVRPGRLIVRSVIVEAAL